GDSRRGVKMSSFQPLSMFDRRLAASPANQKSARVSYVCLQGVSDLKDHRRASIRRIRPPWSTSAERSMISTHTCVKPWKKESKKRMRSADLSGRVQLLSWRKTGAASTDIDSS